MKPILFNTEMVRAILDGWKTVTRRICKDGNEYTVPDMRFFNQYARTYAVHNYADKGHTEQMSLAERPCPICLGDILYVRETWRPYSASSAGVSEIEYKAGGIEKFDRIIAIPERSGRWHPSIHMPKKAARLFLRVTDVRVERLQDITEEQAEAEGAPKAFEYNTPEGPVITLDEDGYFVLGFKAVWNSTIPKDKLHIDGWDANPWVWAYRFERISKDEAQKGGEGV